MCTLESYDGLQIFKSFVRSESETEKTHGGCLYQTSFHTQFVANLNMPILISYT